MERNDSPQSDRQAGPHLSSRRTVLFFRFFASFFRALVWFTLTTTIIACGSAPAHLPLESRPIPTRYADTVVSPRDVLETELAVNGVRGAGEWSGGTDVFSL